MESLLNQKRIQARKSASDGDSIADSASQADSLDVVNRRSSHDRSIEDSSGNDSDNNTEDSEESSSANSDAHPDYEAALISFGALAKAQETLGKRKRIDGDNEEDYQRSKRLLEANPDYVDYEALERKAGKKDTRDFNRTSKHAPTEISSKKAVSRKREVVPTQKVDRRDPRFEPLSGLLDEQKWRKNFSFLDDYRDSEIIELKSAIRKTKDPHAKEKLKRGLLSMESRKKSQHMKEQEQEIVREHRKEEKAKIEQGKKPFYLKKSDRKQLALKKRFEGMKGKQVDKVIERRRKKQAGKEKKSMPAARRG